MTIIPETIHQEVPVVSRSPRLAILRLLITVVFLTACVLWPFTGLTVWHLGLFIILSAGIYYSFSRYVVALAIYFTMMLLYWVIAPVIQSRVGVGYYTWRLDVPAFGPQALAFTSIHFLGIFTGFFLSPIRSKYCDATPSRPSVVGILFSILTLSLLLAVLGYETVFLPRIDQKTLDATTYALFFENVAKLIPALLLTYVILLGYRNTRDNLRPTLLVALLFLMVGVANPINTGRFISLYGILIVFLSYTINFARLRMLAWLIVLSPFYAIFALSLSSMARGGLGSVNFAHVFASLQKLEFSSYSIFLDAIKIESFSQDNYFISHILIFIPRSIWNEKASSLGTFAAESSGYVYSNVGLISFFNAYVDYGLIGLLLVSMLFGFLARNLNPLTQPASFRNRRFMYGVIFTGLTPMVFRGDLSTTMIAFYATAWAYEMTRFFSRFTLRRSVLGS